MILNGFHLVRAVFFALILLFDLLTLSFAALNLSLSSQANLPASATAIAIVFESIALLLCIILGFLESFRPSVKTSTVIFETSWTVILSFLQLGSAISATINGPSYLCRLTSDQQLCSSAALLVPSMWLKSLLSLTYFFTLLIIVLAHRSSVDRIWGESVYAIDWFGTDSENQVHPAKRDFFNDKGSARSQHGSFYSDVEASGSQRDLFGSTGFRNTSTNVIAPWAKQVPMKRGIDSPFSVTVVSPRSTPTASPVLPPKSTLPPIAMKFSTPTVIPPSRFVERFRESQRQSQISAGKLNDRVFPSGVDDHDMPIPKPRGCEWVKADILKSPR